MYWSGATNRAELARPVLVRKSRKLPTLLAICFRTRLLGPCSGSPAIGWFANIDPPWKENNRSRPVIRPLGVSHFLELTLMDFIELNRLLEHSIQQNPLPALAAGVTLAAFLFWLALQALRGERRRVSQGETEQPENENDRLRDLVNHLEGRICPEGSDRRALLGLRAGENRESRPSGETQAGEENPASGPERRPEILRTARQDCPIGREALAQLAQRPFGAVSPLDDRRAAIISTANLKGGVGKTTITANLGATLAKLGLRVLLMDLDYQSSLSNLCLSPQESNQVRRSGRYLNGLLENGGDLSRLNQSVTLLQADVVPASSIWHPSMKTLPTSRTA